MRIDILTLFPDAVEASLKISILAAPRRRAFWTSTPSRSATIPKTNSSRWTITPTAGGWGCVMMAQPLKSCLDDVCAKAGEKRRRVIYMSPQGKTFDQSCARRLAADYDHLVLVCGHYEGVDERFIEECVDEEISLGDFVLTGGEIAAHGGDRTPCVALSPACSRMRSASPARATGTVCSNTRSTPARTCGRGARCRPFCAAA